MAWKCEYVHEVPLRPAANEEQYNLHLAALEWTLQEPIIIENEGDIKSKATWKDRVQPFAHQIQNLITFCRRLPVTLLADEVGLGKTISAGLILSELMARKRVKRALVICPKILGEQWVEELDQKFAITAKNVAGKAELEKEVKRNTPVVVTTYASAALALINKDAFDMLILDEAHKVKNLHTTKPQMALKIHKALQDKLFKHVLMLTATPIQNTLLDMYSLIDCLTVAKGHANPLGTAAEFRKKYLRSAATPRQLNPAHAAEFRDILRQYIARVRKEETKLLFPERNVGMRRVQAYPVERRCEEMVKAHLPNLIPLEQISLLQALFSSPHAFAKQIKNMAEKNKVPQMAAEQTQRWVAEIGDNCAKLNSLLDLFKELRRQRPDDWRAVVFTLRKETQELIGRALAREQISHAFIRGAADAANQKAMADFKKSAKPEVHVLISTDAGAEGVNLQVCNVLVNFDLPWNPMIVEQRIGRVQRLSSTYAHVIVWNLVVENSVEEHVVGRLMEKLQAVSQSLGHIEPILEAANLDADEGDKSFESQVREMVVKSLLGQDVRLQQSRIQRSIDEAKQKMADMQEEIDDTLGRLDEMHGTGPRMERIANKQPSMNSVDFVKRAYQADGAVLEQVAQFVYAATMPRRDKELLAFNEEALGEFETQGVFGGKQPKLFLPGKPAFERLAQSWVEKAGHFLHDLRAEDKARAEKVASQWCASLDGASLVNCEYVPTTKPSFQGGIIVRAKGSNGVDGLEKLITGGTKPPKGHEGLRLADLSSSLEHQPVRPSDVVPTLQQAVATVVENDTDLQKFKKFYDGRLDEELGRAGQDPRRRKQLEDDLSPTVFAEIVALKGVRYSAGHLAVRFALDGFKYQVVLEVVPATAQILAEPERKTCAVTNRKVPESCLGHCESSNQHVLKHFLAKSQISGRTGLMQFLVICPRSGKKVLQDELLKSPSGAVASKDCFQKSDISPCLGLPEDFVHCEFTGAKILKDEALRSEVSGKLFRRDEQVKSAVSGKLGHRSEFITCHVTGQALLNGEAGKSDLSQRWVRKDLLRPSDKPPHRCGLADEMVQCAVTNQVMLRDEAGKSVVSGHWVDKALLVASPCSGAMALKTEMIPCEKTGTLLLPTEVSRCAVTGTIADKRLMAKSATSDQWALKETLVACAKSGARVLPADLTACELTGSKVLPQFLGDCHVTGKRVLLDLLATSSISSKTLLRQHAVVSLLTRRAGTPQEAMHCHWLGGPILVDEAGRCQLTGLSFARQFLNKRGEFAPLRDMLDGYSANARESPLLVEWLIQQDSKTFRGLKQAWALESPNLAIQVVCGRTTHWFGLAEHYVGLLMRNGSKFEPLGRVVTGRRKDGRWEFMK